MPDKKFTRNFPTLPEFGRQVSCKIIFLAKRELKNRCSYFIKS